MTSSKIRIITRESPLAMWQANHVSEQLLKLHTNLEIDIIGISTEADRFLDVSLEKMGGKGAFIKELEQALLDGRADIAVHSMKDVTITLPDSLILAAILEREDNRDVFVSNTYQHLDDLPSAARIGTSSLRRRCQIKALRPDLEIIDIRGNLGTRLKKLDEGRYDALILAAAGIKRLGLTDRINEYLSTGILMPAIGQGALGIEIRDNDPFVEKIVRPLNNTATSICVNAERALSRQLNGGCHAPIAGMAELKQQKLTLRALVGSLDGARIIRAEVSGNPEDAIVLGQAAGLELLDKGAAEILQEIAGNL
jgi:hydroxymethylbilane synthase